MVSVACLAMGACGSSLSTDELVARTFRRWNDLALAANPKVASLVCTNPESPDEVRDPITAKSPGYANPGKLNVGVDGERGVVDFLSVDSATGDTSAVFVTLRRESGTWKVCAVQVTSPGGFG